MTEQEMLSKYGMPDATLNAGNYKTATSRSSEGVCEEYALYYSFAVDGGCTVLGKTQKHGWVINPDLTWPVMALSKIKI